VRARTVAGAMCLVLLASGCSGLLGARPPRPGPAEVAQDGPDCLADEVLALDGTGGGPPGRPPRPAPRTGTVPDGFTPVRVVVCRLELELVAGPPPEIIPALPPGEWGRLEPDPRGVEPEPVPGSGRLTPDTEVPVPLPGDGLTVPGGDPPPAPAHDGGGTVREVTLEGDLAPLLTALARRSDRVPPDQACPAMFEVKPQIYLVDAQGRAVRPQWPVTGCGFLQDGAAELLSELRETSSVERVIAAG
jgi:hypothetical protein